MLTVLLLAGALVAAWVLFARVLGRWHVMGPLAIAIGGAAAGIFITDKVGFGLFLNSNAAERIAELVLALVLFVDATEVRLGAMKAVRGPVLRLLFIALPISMFLAWMFASVLLPDLSLAVTLAIACIIVPVDFSPVTSIVKTTPSRSGCATSSTSKAATTTASSPRCSSSPSHSPATRNAAGSVPPCARRSRPSSLPLPSASSSASPTRCWPMPAAGAAGSAPSRCASAWSRCRC